MSPRRIAVIVALVVFVSATGGGVYTVALFSDSSTVDGQFSTVEAFSVIEPTGSIPNSTTGLRSNSTLVAGNETIVSPGDNETVGNETLSDTISTNETVSEPNSSDKTVSDETASDEIADTDAANNGTAELDAVEEPTTETGTETATEELTTGGTITPSEGGSERDEHGVQSDTSSEELVDENPENSDDTDSQPVETGVEPVDPESDSDTGSNDSPESGSDSGSETETTDESSELGDERTPDERSDPTTAN